MRDPHCLWCGAPLDITPRVGRPPKFCRRAHRQRYHEAQLFDELLTPAVVAKAHGTNCNICTAPVDLQGKGGHAPSLDHDLPRSQGGRHTLSNVRLAHQICNVLKQDRQGFKLPPITTQ